MSEMEGVSNAHFANNVWLAFCDYAVFSLAHRIVCVAKAHQQNPGKTDVRKQLALLKQEAKGLIKQ